MKRNKEGKIEIDADEFADENVSIRISMMIPMTLYKTLKRLSLTEEHGGKYQVMIRDILTEHAEKHGNGKAKKRKTA